MTTARSLNKVILIGNLTRPPVLKKTGNGSVVGTFGVATNATWKDSDGNVQERAEFHNIVAWNKLAEICAQILNTGMLVYLEGELRTNKWEDDETGKKHYRTDIKINDMKLLDSKEKKGIGMDEATESDSDSSSSSSSSSVASSTTNTDNSSTASDDSNSSDDNTPEASVEAEELF